MRQHDALGAAGRARGVEEERGLVRRRRDGGERAGIEEAVERVRTSFAKVHDRQSRRAVGAARAVAKDQPRAAVGEDELDGGARELEIDRHRDEAGAHDAIDRGDEFGAVGGEDRHPVAAARPRLGERAGDAVRHRIERGERELARRSLAAEIDERDLGEIAVAADEIAGIGEHHRLKPWAAP